MVNNEHHRVSSFVSGLQSDIKNQVQLQSSGYLSDAITWATTIEEQNNEEFKQMSRRTSWEQSRNTYRGRWVTKIKEIEYAEQTTKKNTNPYNRPTLANVLGLDKVDIYP